MSIYNLGAIRISQSYRVSRLPKPGETVEGACDSQSLGGAGVAMSLACALAGAKVHHVGAIGADGAFARERLAASGVDVSGLVTVDAATEQTLTIADAKSSITISTPGGANEAVTEAQLKAALKGAHKDDWFLVQGGTSLTLEALAIARAKGLKTCYAPSSFDAATVVAAIDHVDLLALNEEEAAEVTSHMGAGIDRLPAEEMLITMGAKGARFTGGRGRSRAAVPAFRADRAAASGAGDCFLAHFLASRDLGMEPGAALRQGAAAAAIWVGRQGRMSDLPTAAEVTAFLDERRK